MNFTMADAFADAAFKDRNPSWQEFVIGSPAERRAIKRRWNEIRLSGDDLTQLGLVIARIEKARDLEEGRPSGRLNHEMRGEHMRSYPTRYDQAKNTYNRTSLEDEMGE
jgi:hypothetical protein